MVATYVLYNAGTGIGIDLGDTRSADLIVQKKAFLKQTVLSTQDPVVQPPEIASNNLVLLGLWVANPFVRLYFPKLRLDSLYSPEKFPNQKDMWKLAGEFGISADGKYIISTKKRGKTTVTVVGGVQEPDTWKAANIFVSPTISPFIPVGISGAVISGAIYASVR